MEPDPLNGVYVYLDIVGDFVCQQCGVCCNNDWLVTVDEAGYRRNQRLFEQAGQPEEFAQAFLSLGSAAELGNAYVRLGNRDAAISAYRRPLEQKQMPLDPKLAQQFRDQVARLESAPDPKQVPLMRNPWME